MSGEKSTRDIVEWVIGDFYPRQDVQDDYRLADRLIAALTTSGHLCDAEALRIIFDGMPGPEAGRFVEVENGQGRSINVGEWRHRADGLCELVLRAPDALRAENKLLKVEEGRLRQSLLHIINCSDVGRDRTFDKCSADLYECLCIARAALDAKP